MSARSSLAPKARAFRRAIVPLLIALVGVLIPLLSRADDAFKDPYGDDDFAPMASGSSSGSAAASGSASTGETPPPKLAPITSASASPSSSAVKKPPKQEEDPRVIPEGVKAEIGSSYATEEGPHGEVKRSGLWPIAYTEYATNQITTAVFPFYFDRKLLDEKGRAKEHQSFYTLYYRKRSPDHDVDAAFPVYFHWRDEQTTTTIIPPVLWRDAPGEWHRWLAPLVFASSQPDGGYLHLPPLLTFSHHNKHRAFSLIGGLGFYDRTEADVDWGVFPFVFGGNDKDKLTNYLLIPPLLTYHSSDGDRGTSTWVIGPFYSKSGPQTLTLDVLPLFLHHRDATSYSTTFLPFFHASASKDKSLVVTPLFITARDADGGHTLVTPFYSNYRGRTQLDLAGPIVPLFAHYTDRDVFKESWLFGPFYYSHDPTGYTVLTPLFGQWREYGVSNTTWIFPTFEHQSRVDGWSFNIHPLVYIGHDGPSWHDVVAPFWWDFLTPSKRTTVAFPVFWRFRDEDGVTQVALNTLYLDRTSSKGPNYDFYFLPIFHVGEQPEGNAWDVLFGLVGYKREGTYKQLKLFWIPIDLSANPADEPKDDSKKKKNSLKDKK